jgi:hypothetical protein
VAAIVTWQSKYRLPLIGWRGLRVWKSLSVPAGYFWIRLSRNVLLYYHICKTIYGIIRHFPHDIRLNVPQIKALLLYTGESVDKRAVQSNLIDWRSPTDHARTLRCTMVAPNNYARAWLELSISCQLPWAPKCTPCYLRDARSRPNPSIWSDFTFIE